MGLISAGLSSRAASKQARAIREGTDASVAEQRRQYDQTRSDFEPWRQAGINAINQLADPTANFYASPDYEFRRTEGMRDIGNQFAARGSGGNAMKALAGYNSNLASGEFGNWFNRTLAQSEAGRGASGTVAQVGSNAANNMSAAYLNRGNQLSNIAYNKYANINNATVGAISNALYAGMGASDRRLKQNIEYICSYMGHRIYSWAWNDLAKALGINTPTIGVIAQEVEDTGHVYTGPDGYLMVDYNGLFSG